MTRSNDFARPSASKSKSCGLYVICILKPCPERYQELTNVLGRMHRACSVRAVLPHTWLTGTPGRAYADGPTRALCMPPRPTTGTTIANGRALAVPATSLKDGHAP